MNLLQIAGLAVIQGAAELLPVSSSAHVIVAERMMGLDPGSPEMTFLLVMLHTGTMFAVLLYFASRWKKLLVSGGGSFARLVLVATVCTGILGFGLKKAIEKVLLEGVMQVPHGEIEHLFRNLPLISASLFTVGMLIIMAGRVEGQAPPARPLGTRQSALIGIVQGLCLPFRGFSRSGATISTALFCGISRELAEEFSFALAVVLTPPVIALELHRLLKASAVTGAHPLTHAELGALLLPGCLGMVFSFGAGLLALRWLSSWLENGKWRYFGYYCLGASAVVLAAHLAGI